MRIIIVLLMIAAPVMAGPTFGMAMIVALAGFLVLLSLLAEERAQERLRSTEQELESYRQAAPEPQVLLWLSESRKLDRSRSLAVAQAANKEPTPRQS
jgi:ABC-type Fe2+-enterobactin transport system substrate-binding protein